MDVGLLAPVRHYFSIENHQKVLQLINKTHLVNEKVVFNSVWQCNKYYIYRVVGDMSREPSFSFERRQMASIKDELIVLGLLS